MKIAILGSSFNPPHLAHLSIARQVLDFCPIDYVWLMPTFSYNPRFEKKLISFKHRLAMAKYLKRPKVKVSDLEKIITGPSYTYKLIKILQKKCPNNDFSFIIGSDQLENLPQWYCWQKLLKICRFYVFPREGDKQIVLYKNMEIINSPLLKLSRISSSQIRKKIKSRISIKNLTMAKVEKYIKENKLYLA